MTSRYLYRDYDAFDWTVPYKIAHVTGALSMIGSGWIIIEVLLDFQKRKMTYHRIMFGLSFFDFSSSFGFFLSNWAQYDHNFSTGPSSDFLVPKGTIATCNTSGFVIYLGSLTIPLYSATLSMYYYLTICYGWNEARFKEKFNIYVHTLIPSMGIIIAILPLIMELYNPWYFYCFPVYNGIRGNEKVGHIFQLLSLVIVFFSAIITSYAMISISRKVNKVYQNSTRWGEGIIPERKSEICCSFLARNRRSYDPSHKEKSDRTIARERRFQRRSQRVRTMTLLYMIPFFFTWVFPTLLFFTTHIAMYSMKFREFFTENMAFNYALQVYIAIFLPLQGFLNWFVYIYRRYQATHRVWFNRSSVLFTIVEKYFYTIKDTLGRILNLSDSECDDDCIFGSGMEVIDFEEVDELNFDEGNIELPINYIAENKSGTEEEKLNYIDENKSGTEEEKNSSSPITNECSSSSITDESKLRECT